MVTPTFSVVIATYDRGPLIEPTLESVVRQTCDDYEVLVVSDGPAAAGLADAVQRRGAHFSLSELPRRHGSQCAPNNHGWSLARGNYIAYLGHDDIWLPDHLANLLVAFERRPAAQFAVAGCIYFGPRGAGPGTTWVTGMFDPADQSIPRAHFFPPSSTAHRRDLPEALRWPDATTTNRPVDSQFQLNAAEHGAEFTSTQVISVLKFNSALRYLSYLSPDDDEQRDALTLLLDPSRLRATLDDATTDAIRCGNYMTTRHQPADAFAPGETVRRHARIRGIDVPNVEVLNGPTWMPMVDDPRAYDWHPLERDSRRVWRWSGPSPRPRILIPYTHDAPVSISLHVDAFATDDVRDSLEVLVNGLPAPFSIEQETHSPRAVITFETPLRADKASVVELRMCCTVPAIAFAPPSGDQRQLGMCLAGIRLEPLNGSAGQPR